MTVKWRKLMGFCILLIVLVALAYYFLGSANLPGTHSYFWEKRLRHLLFLETHEPVDYVRTLAEYERILPRIRFGIDSQSPARYQRAIARTKVTLELLSHLRHYEIAGDVTDLKQAARLYRSVFARQLNEYDFYTVYIDHTSITEEWFRNQNIKLGLPANSFQ